MNHLTKDDYIDQVIDNNPNEFEKVYEFAYQWIMSRMKEFTSEDLKLAYMEENEPLHQVNLYGAVFRKLAKRGLISYKRHQSAKLPKAHGRQIAVWISMTFRLKQQNNARQEASLSLFN